MSDAGPGSQFGPYYLRRLISRGGLADLYEAEDTARDRTVALKIFTTVAAHESALVVTHLDTISWGTDAAHRTLRARISRT